MIYRIIATVVIFFIGLIITGFGIFYLDPFIMIFGLIGMILPLCFHMLYNLPDYHGDRR